MQVVIVLLALVCAVQTFTCPQMCNCRAHLMTCKCGSTTQPFTLSSVSPSATMLTIRDCQRVQIHGNPFNSLSLDLIEISSSASVVLTEITFLGSGHVRRLHLYDIANLTVSSLMSLKADKLEMRNVTIDILPAHFITGESSIQEVHISDSKIGTLSEYAIYVQNDRSLDIVDCSIQFFAKTSITLGNVMRFSLRGSTIHDMSEDAIHILEVKRMLVVSNAIHTMNEGSFVADGIEEFVFANNSVHALMEQSLYHMINVDKMTLSDNRFRRVDRNGILMHLKVEEAQFSIERNEFFCDCDLTWLWQESGFHKFDKFLTSSTCFGPEPLRGHTLGSVSPVGTTSGDCLRVEPLNDNPNLHQIISSPIELADFDEDAENTGTIPKAPFLAIFFCLYYAYFC